MGRAYPEETGVPVDPSVFSLRAVAAGTLIETDRGAVPAEHLTRKHRLRTIGGRFADLDWLERLDLEPHFLARYPDLKPVLIEAGELGPSQPRRDLLVSPGQMIWSSEAGARTGVFGAARRLARSPDALRDHDIGISYIVFAATDPVVVKAEGVWIVCS